MGLALLTLGLLCPPSAQAQQDQGHYWKVTYAYSNVVNKHFVRDVPTMGQMTPTDSQGGSTIVNGDEEETVTATLTWVPAAGMDNTSDPPPDKDHKVHLKESAGAWERSLGSGPGTGTADDGLGDPVDGNGWSQGTHLLQKDGSSGTITLDPVTLKAINPVSTFQSGYPGGGGYGGYPGGGGYGYWDWTGGEGTISYAVTVDADPNPRSVTITSSSTSHKGPDGKPAADVRDADGTFEMTSIYSHHDQSVGGETVVDTPFVNWIEFTPNFIGGWHFPVSWAWNPSESDDDWNYGKVSMGYGQIEYWNGEAGGQPTGNQTYHVSYTATDNTDGVKATANAKIALHDEWENKQNANPATTFNQSRRYFSTPDGVRWCARNDTSQPFTASPLANITASGSVTLGFKFSAGFEPGWAKVFGIELNTAGTVGGSVGMTVPGPQLQPGYWSFPILTVSWNTNNYLFDHYTVTGFDATYPQSADDPNSRVNGLGWTDPVKIGQSPPP